MQKNWKTKTARFSNEFTCKTVICQFQCLPIWKMSILGSACRKFPVRGDNIIVLDYAKSGGKCCSKKLYIPNQSTTTNETFQHESNKLHLRSPEMSNWAIKCFDILLSNSVRTYIIFLHKLKLKNKLKLKDILYKKHPQLSFYKCSL